MERQEATSLSDIHPGHIARYEFAANRCKGRVLDAACGVGYGSKMLQDSGSQVLGVDIEPEAIGKAQKYYPGPRYIQGDLRYSPWKDEVFDWCVSLETIEHLQKPEEVLGVFRDSCSKLVVSTPNQERYPFDPRKFNGDKYPHIRHYSPRELDRMLNYCGWEVLQRFTQIEKRSQVSEGINGMFLVYVCR